MKSIKKLFLECMCASVVIISGCGNNSAIIDTEKVADVEIDKSSDVHELEKSNYEQEIQLMDSQITVLDKSLNTNSTKITVSINESSIAEQITIYLYHEEDTENQIMESVIDSKIKAVTFDNLSSANNYKIGCLSKNEQNITITVQE